MIRSDQIQAEFVLGKQPGTRLYGGEQENSLSCLIPAVLALLWSRVYKGQTGFEFLGASFSRFRDLRFRVLGASFSRLGASFSRFRGLRFRDRVLRFRDLGASCFGLRFRVLRFRNYPRTTGDQHDL